MFWLDMNKPDEYALAETIAELKEAKAFSRAVRDGIALIVDLWRGNLDVLLDYFPWIEDTFYKRFQEQQPAAEYPLHEQLSRLEQLLLEQGTAPVLEPNSIRSGSRPVAMPDPDDDRELLRITQAATSNETAQNFLSSVLGLQQ